jgi:hypothetical protein
MRVHNRKRLNGHVTGFNVKIHGREGGVSGSKFGGELVLYSNLYGKNLEAILAISIKMKPEAILIDVIILAK